MLWIAVFMASLALFDLAARNTLAARVRRHVKLTPQAQQFLARPEAWIAVPFISSEPEQLPGPRARIYKVGRHAIIPRIGRFAV